MDGVVAKHGNGRTIEAPTKFSWVLLVVLEGITNLVTLEATTCHEALSLAEDPNIQKLKVVHDAANVARNIMEPLLL